MAFATVILMGITFTAIGELFPIQFTSMFMDTTPEVLVNYDMKSEHFFWNVQVSYRFFMYKLACKTNL